VKFVGRGWGGGGNTMGTRDWGGGGAMRGNVDQTAESGKLKVPMIGEGRLRRGGKMV